MTYVPDSMCRECSHYRSGIIISTSSSDFPHIVYVGRNTPVHIFPRSLYFVEHRNDLSKAQKSKFANYLESGDYIDFVANNNNIVTSYSKSNHLDRKVQCGKNGEIMIQDYIVISPTFPRKCWSTLLSGYVDAPQELMNAIPNIVYDAFLAVDAYLTEPAVGHMPQPHVTFALAKICKPVPNDSHVDEVYHAEWNLPDTRGLLHERANASDSSEVIVNEPVILPKPPTSFINGAKLYVMDNRQLIWPYRPYYKVVMGLLPTENEKKLLLPGKNMKADMFYCSFNKFYVVYRYSILNSASRYYAVHPPLDVRQRLDYRDIGGYTEYKVDLVPSVYHGYYSNKSVLKNCLIGDPLHLLLNYSMDVRPHQWPVENVWVRLCESTHEHLQAPAFSISSFEDEELIYHSRRPLIVNEIGFIVNICTGSIFCPLYPTLCIFLIIPQRVDLQLGEYIRFHAIYHAPIDAFVVINYDRVKNLFAVEGIPTSRGFMFKETLDCTTVNASRHLYYGAKFGLVSDLEKVIRTRAEAKNVEMPKSTSVLVEENREKNRTAFFNVYIVLEKVSEKALAADELLETPPTSNWWKSTDPAKCKCQEIKEICTEVAELHNSFIFDDYTPTLTNLLDKLQALVH